LALVVPQTSIDPNPRPYVGSELRPHWIYENFHLQGDALVSFAGPVDVQIGSMVDMADRRDGLFIRGDLMQHFIYESFGADLDRAVLLQKLLVLTATEYLTEKVGTRVTRKGDDVFLDGGKLTVSIATVSMVSCLIHFGVNLVNDGTPLKTGALGDCGVDGKDFANEVMRRFSNEIKSMSLAATKVRGVQ
jgi:hypothetical protein